MGKRHEMKGVAFIAFSILLAAAAFSAPTLKAGVGTPVVEKIRDGNAEKEALYSSKELLQFRSGGLILGFREDRMYMVGMGYALIEEFVGARQVKPFASGGEQAGKKEGMTALTFHGVTYPGLWDGIDLRYEVRDGGLAESVFVVKPHADPKEIMLKYNAKVEVQKDGSLRLTPPGEKGYFTMSAPKAWQEIEGKRVPVEVAFRKENGNTIGFMVGEYHKSCPLIIDPTYQWHTFYGSADEDKGYGIAVDGSGNVYVTGYSERAWNGPNGESPLHAHSGGSKYDIVVLKLDSTGAYQWHTFYGSADWDEGYGIAVDGSGNVYVTGESFSPWNSPSGQSPLHPHSGMYDIVVLKLDTNGTYQWHTFYGSSGQEWGNSIATEGIDHVDIYVTGVSNTYSSWSGPSGQSPLHPHSGDRDIVVLKLDSNGAYQWHTFYGSGSYDEGNGIVLSIEGGSRYVYVAGESFDTWSGPSGQSPLHAHSGGSNFDIVVLKLDTNGTYQWHTFYGSASGDDGGSGIAVDGIGNVYVTGDSDRTWNGPSGQGPLHAHSRWKDIFVLKLSSSGDYQWHTFYGPRNGLTTIYGIAADGGGNVYVTGCSASWDGLTPLNPYTEHGDIVVLKLDNTGAYQWHTFYGTVDTDYSFGIAVDRSGDIYVTGYIWGAWGRPLHGNSGNYDIVVLRMSDSGGGGTGGNYTFTVTKSGGGSGTVNATGCTLSWSENTGTCTAPAGTQITSTASPSSNSTFAGWDGVRSGTGSCTITLNGDTSVTATFKLKTLALRVKKRGLGSVEATASGCTLRWNGNLWICTAPYGKQITLSGLPADSSTFGGWSMGTGSASSCSGKGNCTFTLTVERLEKVKTEKEKEEKEAPYTSRDILQFRSGGHILGFKEDRVYVVGTGYALIEEFVGSREVKPLASGGEQAEKKEKKGAPVFRGVVYSELWEGIDLRYGAREGGVAESMFVVKSNGDPGKIRLKYNAEVEAQKDGSLRLTPPGGKGYFTLSVPKAWQEIEGRKVPVDVAFRVEKGNTVGFRVGEYDKNYPLVIDPTYQWHTFYGSGNWDSGYGIAVDGSGNVYVTGRSNAGWGGPLHPHGGDGYADIVVLKLDRNGQYQWHTFYGSGSWDYGEDIAVDESGNVYVTGESDCTWQGPSGQNPLHPHGGCGYFDIVVLKLNSNGIYQWHTFYGSQDSDKGYGIALDGSSNIYVTGGSRATWGSPLNPHSGGDANDIVVLKLNSDGAYQWHTFYGSGTCFLDFFCSFDEGYGIAVDGSGNIYVTGRSEFSWNGPSGEEPLHQHSRPPLDNDIVVLKLDRNGQYQWHTFYGSQGQHIDVGYGIAVDGSGNVYVTGYSERAWNGPNGESPLHAHSGYEDIVVLKLTSEGAYQWHTFYGSRDSDKGWGIKVDESGNIYVVGESYSYDKTSWQGPNEEKPLNPHSGDYDIVVLKLDRNGQYQWHTFYGSVIDDHGYDLAVDDRNGDIYVAGSSHASWQGPEGRDPLNLHTGPLYDDIVVLKMGELTPSQSPRQAQAVVR
jgi:hypothetical protein